MAYQQHYVEMENFSKQFREEMEATKRSQRATQQECIETNQRQLQYRQVANRLDDSDILAKI